MRLHLVCGYFEFSGNQALRKALLNGTKQRVSTGVGGNHAGDSIYEHSVSQMILQNSNSALLLPRCNRIPQRTRSFPEMRAFQKKGKPNLNAISRAGRLVQSEQHKPKEPSTAIKLMTKHTSGDKTKAVRSDNTFSRERQRGSWCTAQKRSRRAS